MTTEPEYYASNGLSPIGAFKQGLMSKEEYIGFLKGNIIKYVVRAGKKEDAIKDLEKAKHYIEFYLELLSENKEIMININDALNEMNNKLEEMNKNEGK